MYSEWPDNDVSSIGAGRPPSFLTVAQKSVAVESEFRTREQRRRSKKERKLHVASGPRLSGESRALFILSQSRRQRACRESLIYQVPSRKTMPVLSLTPWVKLAPFRFPSHE
jgi:hypothetical protein